MKTVQINLVIAMLLYVALSSRSVEFITPTQAASVVGGTCYNEDKADGMCDEIAEDCGDQACECEERHQFTSGGWSTWTDWGAYECNTYEMDDQIAMGNWDQYEINWRCVKDTEGYVVNDLTYTECGEDELATSGYNDINDDGGGKHYCYKLRGCARPKISEHSKGILAEIADAVSARVERALAKAA